MSKKKETFDLNTAVSFLPVMDDTEDTTKRLISSIEMYDSLLDKESKPVLINFILSSRLSPSAKLRLTKNYKTLNHLVNDMNKFLLTKKSFTVIQQQLSQCTQKNRDIDEYAKEIEKLFVDLTVAQADGDQNKYRILRPVNEKMAIHQFANGLKNSNLSTIILAKDYKSLKDAIQGAKDEQISMSLRPKQVEQNSQLNHPFLWKEPHKENHVKNFDNRDGYYHSRGRGQGCQGNSRGGGHSANHCNQGAPGKNLTDNRDGNNQSQRGRGQNFRGATHSTSNSANHNNQGRNSDNRIGNHQAQRGHSQYFCGANNSGYLHQGAPGKNSDHRDGNKQPQRGHSQTRGNSRGANHSGHQSQGTSNNHKNQGNDKSNSNNQPKKGHDQNSRGNSRGSNQQGSYHNQGNRGKNSNNRGGNNNSGGNNRPVINVSVPELMVDCQFRFTAVAGGANIQKNPTGQNKNNQVAKK